MLQSDPPGTHNTHQTETEVFGTIRDVYICVLNAQKTIIGGDGSTNSESKTPNMTVPVFRFSCDAYVPDLSVHPLLRDYLVLEAS